MEVLHLRINKKLSNYGYCSRKEANKLIIQGRLLINGELAVPGQWTKDDDLILLDGLTLCQKPVLYYVYHKPINILCTMNLEVENSLVHHIALNDYVFPVGRLDQNSEGLLLLTNDGELAQKILSPLNDHEKEYVVTVNHKITEKFIMEMQNGVDINIGITTPCLVNQLSDDEFKITITQGLNRQIRRMCRALGYEVIRLIRTRIINLHLGDQVAGTCRLLSGEELKELRKSLQDRI